VLEAVSADDIRTDTLAGPDGYLVAATAESGERLGCAPSQGALEALDGVVDVEEDPGDGRFLL
jgi:hypothetical protein